MTTFSSYPQNALNLFFYLIFIEKIILVKICIYMAFRSIKGSENYSNILSIIKTSIKRNIIPYDSIYKIFSKRRIIYKLKQAQQNCSHFIMSMSA